MVRDQNNDKILSLMSLNTVGEVIKYAARSNIVFMEQFMYANLDAWHMLGTYVMLHY